MNSENENIATVIIVIMIQKNDVFHSMSIGYNWSPKSVNHLNV